MQSNFLFTHKNLKDQFIQAATFGYRIITCRDYYNGKSTGLKGKILVTRVDVDWSAKKAKTLAEIFNQLGLDPFFIRLYADEYNPLSFKN